MAAVASFGAVAAALMLAEVAHPEVVLQTRMPAATSSMCRFERGVDYGHGSRPHKNGVQSYAHGSRPHKNGVQTEHECCNLCVTRPGCAVAMYLWGAKQCWFKGQDALLLRPNDKCVISNNSPQREKSVEGGGYPSTEHRRHRFLIVSDA